jgi:DNA transformation protein
MKAPARKSKRARRSKGKLKSMRVSDGFREFALDQLSGVRGLRAKSMFGGIGLFANDLFFGILASDVLYFKVDQSNLADYESARSKPFQPYPGKSMTMSYYAVPIAILESAPELTRWASRSVAVAKAGKK